MDLRTVDFAELHFPRKEWQWLRPSARFSFDAPDSFLWAADVGGKLWAWHPLGADIETATAPTARARVLVLKTDSSEIAAHGLYLKTAFIARPAQDVEWVAALRTLTERLGFLPSEKGLPPHWGAALEACGLGTHLGVLAQRGRFVFLTPDEMQFIFDKRWDLATFELLESFKPELRAPFVAALRRWNLGANHAKEAANLILILSKKYGEKPALTVLAKDFQNSDEFRQALIHMAQPELASLAQKRIDGLRALHAPPRTTIYGDPTFESDTLKITHTPRSTADFERFKTWIGEPDTADKIRELLEIYQ